MEFEPVLSRQHWISLSGHITQWRLMAYMIVGIQGFNNLKRGNKFIEKFLQILTSNPFLLSNVCS